MFPPRMHLVGTVTCIKLSNFILDISQKADILPAVLSSSQQLESIPVVTMSPTVNATIDLNNVRREEMASPSHSSPEPHIDPHSSPSPEPPSFINPVSPERLRDAEPAATRTAEPTKVPLTCCKHLACLLHTSACSCSTTCSLSFPS